MSADFSLQFACPVRNEFPEAKLLTLVRYRRIGEFAYAKFRQELPQHDEQRILNECQVAIYARGPDGVSREVPTSLAKLRALVAPIDPYKGHCGSCRANVGNGDFGCIGKINYPVSNEAEAWLLRRLPEDAKSPTLAMLMKFIEDMDVDGAPVARMRTNPKLFRSKTAATRRWGGWFSKTGLDSNQLMQMLVFAGPISPERARLYTKLMRLSDALTDPHPPSPAIEQFKTFFCAIVMAGRLNCTLAIDA